MNKSLKLSVLLLLLLPSHRSSAQASPQLTGDPANLVAQAASSKSTYLRGEPVLLHLAVCNPTSEGISLLYQPACDPPHLEIIDSSGHSTAYETCDGTGAALFFESWPPGQCKFEQTIVWPQTTGRFADPLVPLGPQARPGTYRARYTSHISKQTNPAVSEPFFLVSLPEVPALGLKGAWLLTLSLLALGAHLADRS